MRRNALLPCRRTRGRKRPLPRRIILVTTSGVQPLASHLSPPSLRNSLTLALRLSLCSTFATSLLLDRRWTRLYVRPLIRGRMRTRRKAKILMRSCRHRSALIALAGSIFPSTTRQMTCSLENAPRANPYNRRRTIRTRQLLIPQIRQAIFGWRVKRHANRS